MLLDKMHNLSSYQVNSALLMHYLLVQMAICINCLAPCSDVPVGPSFSHLETFCALRHFGVWRHYVPSGNVLTSFMHS